MYHYVPCLFITEHMGHWLVKDSSLMLLQPG